MIERSQYPEKSFKYGGVRYNFNSSRWSQINKFPPETDIQPQPYHLPPIVILKNSIFTLLPSASSLPYMNLFSINLITEKIKKWSEDEKGQKPTNRVGFGFIEHKNEFYLFGGRKDSQYFNDLRIFNTYSSTWNIVESKNPPEKRIPLIFCSVDNEFIFLMGGKCESSSFEDAYIFLNDNWRELHCEDLEDYRYILRLANFKYCVCGTSIYIFGGYSQNNFSSQLFCLNVNCFSKMLTIRRVTPYNKELPPPRISHSMIGVSDKFVVVAGGFNNEQSFLDINVYDTEQNYWFAVNPLNGPLEKIANFTMISFKNLLYICGGKKPQELNRTLISLTFSEYEMIKSQLCSQCAIRLENQEKEDFNSAKKPFVSNGFIHNLAMEIKFPFQAIGLILDIARLLDAQSISINSAESINKFSFLTFQFDGKPLKREQFVSIISHSHSNDPITREISDKLKFGGQRLGKTIVFITISDEMRRVFMFSSDSLVISHYDQLYSYYAYEERISDKWISTYEGVMHHKFIINTLKNYLENPEATLYSVTNHAILIFENNLLMSADKIYYTELVTGLGDIQQCKNTKKVEFLSNVGFELMHDPQISLKSYLSLLYMKETLKTITVQDREISSEQKTPYSVELEKLTEKNKLEKIKEETIKQNGLEFDVVLYKVNKEQYIPQLKGILVYFHDRLINRFECEFGNLFWDKFYKTKYKRPFPLWMKAGVINVRGGLEPKSTLGGFKMTNNYRKFIAYMKKELKTHERKKAQILLVVDDEEEDRVRKRVKDQE